MISSRTSTRPASFNRIKNSQRVCKGPGDPAHLSTALETIGELKHSRLIG